MNQTKPPLKLEDKIKELKDKYLEYYSCLPIQKLAADFIGRSADTIQNWEKDDPEFSAKTARAKAEWARTKAVKVRNPEWLLERITRDQFSPPQQKTDVTSGGEPLKSNTIVFVDFKDETTGK